MIEIRLETDSCLTGCGPVPCAKIHITIKCPPHIIDQNLSICHLELLNIVIAVKTWPPHGALSELELYASTRSPSLPAQGSNVQQRTDNEHSRTAAEDAASLVEVSAMQPHQVAHTEKADADEINSAVTDILGSHEPLSSELIGRASLVFTLRDVTRFMPLLARLVQ